MKARSAPCPQATAGEPLSPSSRRRHGVYATPPPVVGYLVRSVHRLLQERLGWAAGLAACRVRLLDPTAGRLDRRPPRRLRPGGRPTPGRAQLEMAPRRRDSLPAPGAVEDRPGRGGGRRPRPAAQRSRRTHLEGPAPLAARQLRRDPPP